MENGIKQMSRRNGEDFILVHENGSELCFKLKPKLCYDVTLVGSVRIYRTPLWMEHANELDLAEVEKYAPPAVTFSKFGLSVYMRKYIDMRRAS